MSTDEQSGRDDLELTQDDADHVKGGVLPIEGGDSLSSGKSYTGKKKKKKKQQKIGPYQGKH